MNHSVFRKCTLLAVSILVITTLKHNRPTHNIVLVDDYKQKSVQVESRSYLERLEYYKFRYNYKPPESYTEHKARSVTCGEHPTFQSYFDQPGTIQRSANEEDLTLFEKLFNETYDSGKGSPIMSIIRQGCRVLLGWCNIVCSSSAPASAKRCRFASRLPKVIGRSFAKFLISRPQKKMSISF